MLTFDQSSEDNRKEFIARLLDAGWTEDEAQAEWDRIQVDCEGEP